MSEPTRWIDHLARLIVGSFILGAIAGSLLLIIWLLMSFDNVFNTLAVGIAVVALGFAAYQIGKGVVS